MSAERDDVAAQLKTLEGMSGLELRERWKQVFGRPHPGWVQRDFLIRGLAYHAQEKAYGGLGSAHLRRLLSCAEQVHLKGALLSPARLRVKPGTRFVREWGGDTHVVTALEEEFEYRGKRYKSLSEIARLIAKVRWSGPAFFGLKSRTPARTNGERP